MRRAALGLAVVMVGGCGPGPSAAPAPVSPAAPARPAHDRVTVFTYFYYWYDQASNYHLGPGTPLPNHPPPSPAPSWRSQEWFATQLSDMAYAGIDVALPVYWGFGREQWSTEGLATLVGARDQLVAAGRPAPSIGMFFDTSILAGRDLRDSAGIEFFYANLHDFFSRVPDRHWERLDGRPVVWLFLPQSGNSFGQQLFDTTYANFMRDFGVRPIIVRATGWDCPITSWGPSGARADCGRPTATDGSYVWGTAQNGYQPAGTVASVGPGYDEREIPGRTGVYRPRSEGAWYTDNFRKAMAARKPLLALETWNEFHEASGIAETVEYGRRYLDLTRQLVSQYREAANAG